MVSFTTDILTVPNQAIDAIASFATDIGTSSSQFPCLTITAHYIHKAWRSLTLDFVPIKGSRPGLAIADTFYSIVCNYYKLQHV